jgi:hypothetical protein
LTVLAYDGAHRLEVPEADAQSGAGAAHELYVAIHDVIGQLRLAEADRR